MLLIRLSFISEETTMEAEWRLGVRTVRVEVGMPPLYVLWSHWTRPWAVGCQERKPGKVLEVGWPGTVADWVLLLKGDIQADSLISLGEMLMDCGMREPLGVGVGFTLCVIGAAGVWLGLLRTRELLQCQVQVKIRESAGRHCLWAGRRFFWVESTQVTQKLTGRPL